MNRLVAVAMTLLFSVAVLSPPVMAQQDEKSKTVDLLDVIPADAWGAVCIPSVANFDKRLTAFLQPLQLPMMMGPPVTMAKMMLGLHSGFDDNGGVVITMLSPTKGNNQMPEPLILLPVTDYGELMKALSAEATGDGANKLFFIDKQSYAIPFKEKFAAISPSREGLNRLSSAKGTLRTRLSDEQKRLWNGKDITFWMDAKNVFSHPTVKGMMGMLEQMGVGTSQEELEQLDQLQVYASFDPDGLSIGGYADAQPGTEMAKSLASVKGTNESLLKGLPNERYIAAVGFQSSKTYAELSAKSLDRTIQQLLSTQRVDEEKWSKARGSLMTLARSVVGMSADIVALPEGKMAANVVVRTDGGSAEFQSALASLVEEMKSALGSEKDSEAAEMVSLLSYNKNAEKHEGLRVDQLSFKLPNDADAHVREQIEAIFGEKDLTVRISAVDKDAVVMTLGGGLDQVGKLVSAARSNNASLTGDAGIKRMSDRVGSKRTMEAYIAVDRLMQFAAKIAPQGAGAMQMPDVNAPVLLHGRSIDDRSAGGEMYVPMDLLIAIKNVAMNAMAQQMGGPGNQAPPEPDEGAAGM